MWQISPDLEAKLRSLGNRGDIIKTMHRSMREAGIDRPAGSFTMFDTAKLNKRIVGCVAGIGLTDEINDRHYLVVDGIDGKVHYADIGHVAPELLADKGMIVAVETKVTDGQAQSRVQARILSYLNLEKLVEADGATWLDKELLSRKPEYIVEQGFGEQVNKAISMRRQWLIDNTLANETVQGQFQPSPNLLQQLRQRDLRQACVALSKELGLNHVEPLEGQQITGKFTRTAELASGKYAVIQKAKEFVLVPWQREFERFKGKPIIGTVNGQSISWEWGSERKKGIGGLAI